MSETEGSGNLRWPCMREERSTSKWCRASFYKRIPFIFLNYVYMGVGWEVGGWEYVVSRGLPYPEEGIRSPGAGVTGECELPALGAGSRTLDLCRGCLVFFVTEPSLQPSVLHYRTAVLNSLFLLQASWDFKMIIERNTLILLWFRKGEGSPYHPPIHIYWNP